MWPKDLKNPMTKAGFERLAAEHKELLHKTRPKVVQGIADAAAEGDRSENAEYIYGKKRLREIDKRLRYLTTLLKDVDLVEPDQVGGDRVFFGATITVADEAGRKRRWTIVGVGEADLAAGTISWSTPVAKALMGKGIGDIVQVETPDGEVEYKLLTLSFGIRQVFGRGSA